jgi:hypothetical protein
MGFNSAFKGLYSANTGLGFYADIFPLIFNLRTRIKISVASAPWDSFLL